MLRYGLDSSAVRRGTTGRSETIDGIEFEVSNRGGHARERCWALHLVCDALGCKGAQHWTAVKGRGIRGAGRVTMTVIGPEPVLDGLRILLPSLTLQMENHLIPALHHFTTTAPHHLDTTGPPSGAGDVHSPGDGDVHSLGDGPGLSVAKARRAQAATAFRRAFYVGFGSGVATKLRARVAEVSEQIKGTGAELVLLDRTALVQAEFARRYPGLKKARSTPLDPTGYTSGRQAGHQADLNDRTLSDLPANELPPIPSPPTP